LVVFAAIACAGSAPELSPLDTGWFALLKRVFRRLAHREFVAGGRQPLADSRVADIARAAIRTCLGKLPGFFRKCGIVGSGGSEVWVPRRVQTTTALPFSEQVIGAPAPKRLACGGDEPSDHDADGEDDSGSDDDADADSGRLVVDANAAGGGGGGGAVLERGSGASKRRVPLVTGDGRDVMESPTRELFSVNSLEASDAGAAVVRAALRRLDPVLSIAQRLPSGACADEADRLKEQAALAEALSKLRASDGVSAAALRSTALDAAAGAGRDASEPAPAASARSQPKTLDATLLQLVADTFRLCVRVFRYMTSLQQLSTLRCASMAID
jgi:hypothetical protein